jgi:hypothetical protein
VSKRITKDQARSYVERWEAVRAIQTAELRATTAEEKLQQLASLMAVARALGFGERDDLDAYSRSPWYLLRGMHLG